MRRNAKRRRSLRFKTRLGLPDLDHARSAVLVSLRSPESQRSYRHSIDDFVSWYCSEPRLSFNKTVVTRFRIYLENRMLSPGTINVRLAAVRRLAYEAADSGLLSPDLAAGIRRVKGVRKLGTRLGNWLTANEARALWQLPSCQSLKGKRDRAILAVLLGCGLRRRELIELNFDHFQRRDEHWPSLISSARVDTSGLYPCPIGSKGRLTFGRRPRGSSTEEFFAASAETDVLGAAK